MPQWGSVKECILIRFDVSIFVRMYLCEHVSHTQCVLHGRVQTKHVSFRFMRILNLWCLATRNSIGYVFGSKNEVYTIDVTELILNAVALDARRFQTIFCFSAVPEKKFGSLWVLEFISYCWIVVFYLLGFDMTTLLSWKLRVFLENHTICQWNPKSCCLVSPSNVMKKSKFNFKIQIFQYTQYMFRTSLDFFVPSNPLLVNHI